MPLYSEAAFEVVKLQTYLQSLSNFKSRITNVFFQEKNEDELWVKLTAVQLVHL